MIEDFYEITEKGELLPPDWAEKNMEKNIFQVKKIIGAQWKYNGKIIIKKQGRPIIIFPNKKGVITTESKNVGGLSENVVIYNPDGSERFRVRVPVVSKHSKPDEGYYYLADFEKDGSCTVYLNDGAVDYKAKLNVKAGELGDFEQTRV